MKRFVRHLFPVLLAAALALSGWIGWDLTHFVSHDLAAFDGHTVALLERDMWRAYYEHHPERMFMQLGQLLRTQYGFPWWRSQVAAYYAAHAAVVFQRGQNRQDYLQALPDLERYYAMIHDASLQRFDARRAAALELEWWITHRERDRHLKQELVDQLAALQAEIYGIDRALLFEHAQARADAMLLRDARGTDATDEDWRRIGDLLNRSWVSLRRAIRQ